MIVRNTFILLTLALLQSHLLMAQSWQGADYQNRSRYENEREYKSWQSGQGVTAFQPARFLKVSNNKFENNRNPWKPNGFAQRNLPNGHERPWGNIPGPKHQSEKGMKYYDEAFKKWSHRLDTPYVHQLFDDNELSYPGAIGLHRPFGLYPFTYPLAPPLLFDGYRAYPYDGYYRNRPGAQGLMRDFMPW